MRLDPQTTSRRNWPPCTNDIQPLASATASIWLLKRPRPAITDEALLAAIHADLERSPWTGEGHRKVWARLRVTDTIRVSRKRVLRLMRENTLLSPHRARTRTATPHDGHATRRPHHHSSAKPDVAAATRPSRRRQGRHPRLRRPLQCPVADRKERLPKSKRRQNRLGSGPVQAGRLTTTLCSIFACRTIDFNQC